MLAIVILVARTGFHIIVRKVALDFNAESSPSHGGRTARQSSFAQGVGIVERLQISKRQHTFGGGCDILLVMLFLHRLNHQRRRVDIWLRCTGQRDPSANPCTDRKGGLSSKALQNLVREIKCLSILGDLWNYIVRMRSQERNSYSANLAPAKPKGPPKIQFFVVESKVPIVGLGCHLLSASISRSSIFPGGQQREELVQQQVGKLASHFLVVDFNVIVEVVFDRDIPPSSSSLS